MPAGVAGDQPNDALTAVKLLATTIDTHLLMASLQRSGISVTGAQQFSQGDAVTNPADRRAIAAMLSILLKRASGLG